MSSEKCRAKNPNNCRHHGSSIVAKMKQALESLNFSDYAKHRDDMENAKIAELPVSERPQITTEDAYNAVRANYGSMDFNSMVQAKKEWLANDEFDRLSEAAKYMPERVVTPEAIDTYISVQRQQEQRAGTWVEKKTEDGTRLSRLAAKHVLTCTMNSKGSDPDVIGVAEKEEIRKAEADAEAFYGGIAKEENERLRLTDTRAMCNLMWENRHKAKDVVTAHLNSQANSFTDKEKETLIRVAENLHPDNGDYREATKALRFITSTNRLYQNMQNGYHFPDFPMTELFQRYER